jgi:glycosyltransferase involved in cell wall biosynthesis
MNFDLPFFSIIIPTYERRAQLFLCLQALARLEYPIERFEVLVVDDGSESPPGNVVEEFRDLLDLRVLNQKNSGPAAARNLGSLHARGEFLAFTDDDCQADPGWLRELACRFVIAPDCLIGGRTFNALPHNPYSETSQTIIDVVYSHFNADPRDARFFASNNFAVATELFREMKGFEEAFITSEDREICARWRSRGFRLSYSPDAIVYHAHDLTLRTLWWQHFGYGCGARRFHRARALQGSGRFKPDMAFYFKLLSSAASHRRKSRVLQSTALLLWSQLANAAGFFHEMLGPQEPADVTRAPSSDWRGYVPPTTRRLPDEP